MEGGIPRNLSAYLVTEALPLHPCPHKKRGEGGWSERSCGAADRLPPLIIDAFILLCIDSKFENKGFLILALYSNKTIIMLATSLRRTALSAAKKSSCINTTTAATTTSRCFASAPVDFDHFSSGWEKDSSEYKTEGKFHIETFNKISPLVSFLFSSLILV
jgi:hypothetical protein